MLYTWVGFYYLQKAQKAQKERLTTVFVQLIAKIPHENVQKGAESTFTIPETAQKDIFSNFHISAERVFTMLQ